MSRLGRTIKTGITTGLCAFGSCGLERKYRFSKRLADLARSLETFPFPGTRFYTFTAWRLLRPLCASIADEIVSAGHFTRILDIGTGLGYLPIEIAHREPNMHVSGIDESQEMVDAAKINARTSKVEGSVHFVQGDPSNLPYPGRHFDLVVIVSVLHRLRNLKAVFDEVNHVLEPGGEFWLCDYRNDISVDVWESIRAKLPIKFRVPLALGPMALAMSAHGEAELFKMAAESNFEVLVFEERTFSLFGQPMPLFSMLKLRKPLTPVEHPEIISDSVTEN